jgi:predicted acyl esterase
MNRLKLLFFAVFALLYFIQPLESQQNRARDDYKYLKLLPKYNDAPMTAVTRVDFTVTLRDGTILDALKFIPAGTPPAGGWPTVIFVHGYGDNKETLAGLPKHRQSTDTIQQHSV